MSSLTIEKKRSFWKRQCQYQRFEFVRGTKESQMKEIERDVLMKSSYCLQEKVLGYIGLYLRLYLWRGGLRIVDSEKLSKRLSKEETVYLEA